MHLPDWKCPLRERVMRSAYSSSPCFFDSISDSIKTEDVDRCRSCSPASFSSLANLFRNPKSSSALFSNERGPAYFIPNEEVHFPGRKKKDCVDKSCVRHDIGSGRYQTEDIAQESSSFLVALSNPSFTSSGPTSPGPSSPSLQGSCSLSCSFSAFGSATSMSGMRTVEQEFSFPSRKKRGVEGSWLEDRASRRECVTTEPRIFLPPPTSFTVDPCKNSSPLRTMSSSSPVGMGIAVGDGSDTEEIRCERQECCNNNSGVSGAEGMSSIPGRRSPSRVSSLAEMYLSKPGNRSSGVFSETPLSKTEEAVFPKRKERAERNAWRDWTNSGHADDEEQENANNVGFEEGYWLWTSPTLYADVIRDNNLHANVNKSEDSDTVMTGWHHLLSTRRIADGKLQLHAKSDDRPVSINPNISSFNATDKQPRALRSLARREFRCLPMPHHMPWVQLRPIRTQGRFMLQEVKVTQPVVFQPIRSEGRLILELIGHQKQQVMYGKSLDNSIFREKSPEETQLPFAVRERIDLKTEVTFNVPEMKPASGKELFLKSSGLEGVEFVPMSQDARKNFAKVWPKFESLALELADGEAVVEVDCSWTPKAMFSSTRHVSVTDGHEIGVDEAHCAAASCDKTLECVCLGRQGTKMFAEEQGRHSFSTFVGRRPECLNFAIEKAGKNERKEFAIKKAVVVPAAVAGPRIRKPSSCNSHVVEIISACDLTVAEPEKIITLEGGDLCHDGEKQPWILRKGKPAVERDREERRPCTRKRALSDFTMWDKFPLTYAKSVEVAAAAARREVVGEKKIDRINTFPKVRETASSPLPVRTQLQTTARAQNLRNGLVAGLGCPRPDGETNLKRNQCKRNYHHQQQQQQRHISISAFGSSAGIVEMGRSPSPFPPHRSMTDPSLYHGMLRDAVITYTFFRSLRSRPDLHSEHDESRLHASINFASVGASAFSCADGMGKGHHEKNFWEQQPCVS